MLSRRILAWRLAEEEDRRDEERQELARRRRKLLPPRILSDTHFVQRYRLKKEGFEYLCKTLGTCTNLRRSQRVSLENKILCALLFYANGDYQRVVGIANGFSQEAISRYVEEVTMVLNQHNNLKKYIKFPKTRTAREQLQQNFYNKFGIPGVIGCIDGCHFKIVKPKKDEEHLFYCRKHYHSLNVQKVCDHQCRILSINPKFGGASHDAFIWDNSDINAKMQSLHQSGESVWLLDGIAI